MWLVLGSGPSRANLAAKPGSLAEQRVSEQPPEPAPAPTSDEEAESGGNTKRLERYPVIPLIGGFIQAHYGFKELKSGSPLEQGNGRIDIALGTATSIGQISQVPVYADLMVKMSHGVLAICGPLAGIAGVVSSVVDGGRDIYNGYKLDHPSDVAVGAVKIGSGLLSAAGAGATVLMGAATANVPMMIVGTGIYVGATVYQNREAIAKEYHNVVNSVSDHLHRGLQFLGGN